MGLTRFPHGVSSFGIPVLGSGDLLTTGSVFFVNSVVGSNGNTGTDPDSPFATIDYAIGNCTASKGDVIIVMAGHSESISGAGAIAADVAGVSIIGLGAAALRPKITLHTTTTTIAVSAANVTFKNLQILTDITAVVSCFNITGAGCTLDAVDFVESASCACKGFVLTAATADDLVIKNCSWVQTVTATAAVSKWITLIGADRAKILNNYATILGYATGNVVNSIVSGATTLSADVEIGGNRFTTLGASSGAIPILMYTGSTGHIYNNYVASAKTAIVGQITPESCYCAENYGGHVAGTNAIACVAADT